ncbi:MAG TPA: response regulator [Puia sp.]|nr:response regulator [Puia sp.]
MIEDILRGKSILVTDDDPRNTYALSCYLDAMGIGMKVLTALNGRDAVRLLDAYDDIDIVLMDIMMPDIDGYECIRQIRTSNGTSSKVPIIAVTAKAMKGDKEKCLEAGASGYVSKPVDMDELLRTMAGVLNPLKA